MTESERLDPWDSLLSAVSHIGAVEQSQAGFVVTFVDHSGNERRMVAQIAPDDWRTYLAVIWGGDPENSELLSQKVARMIVASDSSIKSIVLSNDYSILLVPYVRK